MIDLTKKYKRNGVPVEVGVIGGVLISVNAGYGVFVHNPYGGFDRDGADILIPYNEWEDFKEGEPVMVRRTEAEEWTRRHFAGIKNGKPTAYHDGTTKWSSKNGQTTPWKFCRRPTKEELGE